MSAFNNVSQNKLLWELENVEGLRGKILEWITHYLKDKEMRTVIRGTFSNITHRVLQGSVIAPTMFQIYVNDMEIGVISCINLCADDAKLFKL